MRLAEQHLNCGFCAQTKPAQLVRLDVETTGRGTALSALTAVEGARQRGLVLRRTTGPVAAHAACQAAMGREQASSRLQSVISILWADARQQGAQRSKHSGPLHSAGAVQRPSCQKPGLSRSSAWWQVYLLPWLQYAVVIWARRLSNPVLGSSHADTDCQLNAQIFPGRAQSA